MTMATQTLTTSTIYTRLQRNPNTVSVVFYIRNTSCFFASCDIRLLRCVFQHQAEAADGETWDSSALHGTLQRYPRKDYCALVKETLATMDEKAAQSKRDQDRLADIHSKVS